MGVKQKQRVYLTSADTTSSVINPPQAHDPIELNGDKVVWLFSEDAFDLVKKPQHKSFVVGEEILERLQQDPTSVLVNLQDRFAAYLFDEGVDAERAVEIAEEVITGDFIDLYRKDFLDAIKQEANGLGYRYYEKKLDSPLTKDELDRARQWSKANQHELKDLAVKPTVEETARYMREVD